LLARLEAGFCSSGSSHERSTSIVCLRGGGGPSRGASGDRFGTGDGGATRGAALGGGGGAGRALLAGGLVDRPRDFGASDREEDMSLYASSSPRPNRQRPNKRGGYGAGF
jgi:hypothetical protein